MSDVVVTDPERVSEYIFLAFRVGPVVLAQPVMRLREVLRYRSAKPVPYAPPFIEGIINLRGELIPVLDLRKRFGYPAELTSATRIIITWIHQNIIGLVVDEAAEIIHVAREQIRPVPALPETALQDLIIGAIVRPEDEEGVILLPDFELLLRPAERREWQIWEPPAPEAIQPEDEVPPAETSSQASPKKTRAKKKASRATGSSRKGTRKKVARKKGGKKRSSPA